MPHLPRPKTHHLISEQRVRNRSTRRRTGACRLRLVAVAISCIAVLMSVNMPSNLGAQEANVESVVRSTLLALSEGRYDDFIAHFDPAARGFFLDGGPLLATGFSVDQLNMAAAAGAGVSVDIDELDSRIHGDAAVSVAYLEGSLTLPGGVVIEGTWRYSETRIRRGGAWRIVQFHMSPLEEGVAGAGRP